MARLHPCVWLLVLSLAGCDRAPPPATTAKLLLEGGQVQWQGMLPCADCDGIRTSLVLQRRGQRRDYTLTETYLDEDVGTRFVERGEWTRERDLLRLSGMQGSVHVYALLADGRLQLRDGHGDALNQRENHFLVPVTTPTAP